MKFRVHAFISVRFVFAMDVANTKWCIISSTQGSNWWAVGPLRPPPPFSLTKVLSVHLFTLEVVSAAFISPPQWQIIMTSLCYGCGKPKHRILASYTNSDW